MEGVQRMAKDLSLDMSDYMKEQAKQFQECREVLRDLVRAPLDMASIAMLQQRARQLLIKQTGGV